MKEIFVRPTIHQVIYQIRFPNLLFIEAKVGQFQLNIMERFPDSSELYRRQVIFADVGPDDEQRMPLDEQNTKKIWQFSTEDKAYVVNIQTNSLDITANSYKTYNSGEDDNFKFQSIIKFVLDNFFSEIPVKLIKRIGLRYINKCPLPDDLSNSAFLEYYDSDFNLSKYDLKTTTEMQFVSSVLLDKYFLNYSEVLKYVDNKPLYYLDWDASGKDIHVDNYLTVTDQLHQIIDNRFFETIKEPVKKWMRNE